MKTKYRLNESCTHFCVISRKSSELYHIVVDKLLQTIHNGKVAKTVEEVFERFEFLISDQKNCPVEVCNLYRPFKIFTSPKTHHRIARLSLPLTYSSNYIRVRQPKFARLKKLRNSCFKTRMAENHVSAESFRQQKTWFQTLFEQSLAIPMVLGLQSAFGSLW